MKPGDIDSCLTSVGSNPLSITSKLNTIISRPNVKIGTLLHSIPQLESICNDITFQHEETIETAEIAIKYEVYIVSEQQEAAKMRRLENIRIRGVFDYSEITQISTEGRQKLSKVNPETLGQASRIPGVSPSDINVLLVLMHR